MGTFPTGSVFAVVPSLLGPLQTLLLMLPLIVMGCTLAARSLTSLMAWRAGVAHLFGEIRSRPIKCGGYFVIVLAVSGLLWWSLQPVQGSMPALDIAVANGNWPTFHGDAARTGKADSTGVGVDVELLWKFRDASILDRGPFASSAAVVGNRVLIGGDSRKLYCLNLEDGAPQWTFTAGHPIFSSPVVSAGRVYVGEGLHYTSDAKLYCLDLSNGTVVWDFQTSSHTESTPTVVDGRVYFGAGDDGLYCLDAVTGRLQWQFADAHVDGGPLVHGSRVFFGSGYTTKAVICVDAGTGRLVWKKDLPVPAWGAPALWGDKIYVGIGNGNFQRSDEKPQGAVLCRDPDIGREIWRFGGVKDGVLTSIAVSENRAVFGGRDGACYALDASTGSLVWRHDVETPIVSSPAIVGTQVLFGADDGWLYCVDLNDGHEVWAHDTSDDLLLFGTADGGIRSSPAVAAGKVVFGASNGNVYCLESRGATKVAQAVIAQAQHNTRLMRAADYVGVGFIKQLAWATGSFGWAIILAALALKLVLLPIDWKQSREQARFHQLQPELERLQRDYVDYRIHRFEVRRLYRHSGINAFEALGLVLVQTPLFIIVLLVIQSTPVFAGESFLWISDLSVADRAAGLPSIASLRSEIHVLPLVLVASVWFYSMSLRGPGNLPGLLGQLVWLLIAIGLGALTYRWSAALHLFFISLLWVGMAESWLLLGRARRATAMST